MKLGIMQPYFLPYIGYWQLLNHVDTWVFFDNIQFKRHSWINRNRIIHQDKEFNYINLPLDKPSFKKIKEITLSGKLSDHKKRIISQLTIYKNKKAPFYNRTIDLVNSILSIDSDNLSEILLKSILEVNDLLNIKTKIILQSSLDINYDIKDSGDWAFEISKYLNADEYVNPISGKSLFDKKKFIQNNIKLSFFENSPINYYQNSSKFVPNLSIVDLLMWNDLSNISSFLNFYDIIE